MKIERLRIELAVLLMISLVTLGGFMSLGISDDGSDPSISDAEDGNELTGELKIGLTPQKKCRNSGGTWIAGRGRAKCYCPQNKVLQRDVCVNKLIPKPVSSVSSPTLIKPTLPLQKPTSGYCTIGINDCPPQLRNKVQGDVAMGVPVEDYPGKFSCLITNVRNPNEKLYLKMYTSYDDPYYCKRVYQTR